MDKNLDLLHKQDNKMTTTSSCCDDIITSRVFKILILLENLLYVCFNAVADLKF